MMLSASTENLAHDLGKPRIIDRPRSKRVDHHRNRIRDADRICELDFAACSEFTRHDVLAMCRAM